MSLCNCQCKTHHAYHMEKQLQSKTSFFGFVIKLIVYITEIVIVRHNYDAYVAASDPSSHGIVASIFVSVSKPVVVSIANSALAANNKMASRSSSYSAK